MTHAIISSVNSTHEGIVRNNHGSLELRRLVEGVNQRFTISSPRNPIYAACRPLQTLQESPSLLIIRFNWSRNLLFCIRDQIAALHAISSRCDRKSKPGRVASRTPVSNEVVKIGSLAGRGLGGELPVRFDFVINIPALRDTIVALRSSWYSTYRSSVGCSHVGVGQVAVSWEVSTDVPKDQILHETAKQYMIGRLPKQA